MTIARSLTGILIALPMVVFGPCHAAVPHQQLAQQEDFETAEVIEEEWVNPVPQPRNMAVFRNQMLRDHNRVRENLAVPPLDWDDELAAEAAEYAESLAETRRFQHSQRLAGRPVEGENLWMGTLRAYSYGDMVDAWIDECREFKRGQFPNLSLTGSWHDVGHYTQMIWAGTKSVGCAIASNETDEYMVCRYYPAGNVWGHDPLELQKTVATSLANASAR
jgi:hypothetical protein